MSSLQSLPRRAGAFAQALKARLRAQPVAWTQEGVYKPASEESANALLVPRAAFEGYAGELALLAEPGEALRRADAYAQLCESMQAGLEGATQAREELVRALRQLVPAVQSVQLTDDDLADLLPASATVLEGERQNKVCMTRLELLAFAHAVIAFARVAREPASGDGTR